MNADTEIVAWSEIRIGNNVMLAPNASITDHNQHETEPGAITSKGPVIIGNNVWTGKNAVVTPGASIGDGSVIGANSVVTRDIPPNSLGWPELLHAPSACQRYPGCWIRTDERWLRPVSGNGMGVRSSNLRTVRDGSYSPAIPEGSSRAFGCR